MLRVVSKRKKYKKYKLVANCSEYFRGEKANQSLMYHLIPENIAYQRSGKRKIVVKDTYDNTTNPTKLV